MKSKLRKALGITVVDGFTQYLNGELKHTHDSVNDYANQFDDCDLECIRAEKLRLRMAIAKYDLDNLEG